MRRTTLAALVLLCGAVLLVSPWQPTALGGEPVLVGGRFPPSAVPGVPFTWDTSSAILYRTDPGPLSKTSTGTVVIDNAAAIPRVQSMFQVWQDVTTATIAFSRAGAIKTVGAYVGGDVDTMAEYDAVTGNCGDERSDPTKQSPIIFDADGTLFAALGFGSNTIGFAGPCLIGTSGGVNRLFGGLAALNGKFQDGQGLIGVTELTAEGFNQAFTHEFGHLAGLGHSQINVEVLGQFPNCNVDDNAGLPLMFPILQCEARVTAGLPPLAPDDEAWISFLYPAASFSTQYGHITGKILFPDGMTGLQGGNVIARQPNLGGGEDRRNAVSVVSGFLFTGNPGQTVTCINPGSPSSATCTNVSLDTNLPGSDFGNRDVALAGKGLGDYDIPIKAGNYTIEVESIDPMFTAGSSVGPIGAEGFDQIPLPGPKEFWNTTESNSDTDPVVPEFVTVVANATNPDKNIIINGTLTRFDTHESARVWLREPAPAWVREEIPWDIGAAG